MYALLMAILISSATFAQNSTPESAGFSISTNTMLLVVIFILLAVILLLANIVSNALDVFRNKKSKTITTVALLILTTLSANAQEATTTSTGLASMVNTMTLVLSIVIAIELAMIVYLVKQIRFLTGIEDLEVEEKKQGKFRSLWDKINSFKTAEEEEKLDIGHSYDGIRELDNVAPPWFTIGFAATILFAFVYMYRYHVSHSAPLQIEEFEIEMKKAQAEKEARDKLNPPKVVDENNIKMLSAAEIEKGKTAFVKNCATCHANDGGGGAGPNLTDDYWLHGGSMNNIFASIKHGYPEKGMPGWIDILGAEQVDQLTSYIKSLKGSSPAAPKEKQGELYNEDAAPVAQTE